MFKRRNKKITKIRLIQNEPIDNSLLSESDSDILYVLNSLGNKRVLENALTLLKMFRQYQYFNSNEVSINGKNYWEFMRVV